eukprot:scaffold48084_cov61-Attheya_sp.AAC.2
MIGLRISHVATGINFSRDLSRVPSSASSRVVDDGHQPFLFLEIERTTHAMAMGGVRTGQEEDPLQSSLTDWVGLLDSCRSVSRGERTGPLSREWIESSYTTHFPALAVTLRTHADALQRQEQQKHEETEHADITEELVNTKIPTDGHDIQKSQILETRRALRFGLSCLSLRGVENGTEQNEHEDPIQRMVQSEAVKQKLHMPICHLLSLEACDTKVRSMAAKILCNLVTANRQTASVLATVIHISPTEDAVTSRLLQSMTLSNNTQETESGYELESRNNYNWVDMMVGSARAGNRDALAAIVAALHNCIVSLSKDASSSSSVDEPNSYEDLSRKASSNTALICNLLRQMLPSKSIVPNTNESKSTDSIMDHADGATEWISLLLERLCQMGMLSKMFIAASSTNSSNRSGSKMDVVVIPEQVVLLHCISHFVEESMDPSSKARTAFHPLGGEGGGDAMTETHTFLANSLCSIGHSLPTSLGPHDGGGGGDGTELYEGELQCRQSAHILILEILATSLAHETSSSNVTDTCATVRETVGQNTSIMVDCLVELGKLVDALTVKTRGKKARELRLETDEQQYMTGYIRLIGNLCYQCKSNQDMLRQTQVPIVNVVSNDEEPSSSSKTSDAVVRTGLHVLLTCTSFSFGCFTLREWAIVAIRNALDRNNANQDVVEKLEAQQALDSPELQNAGVKVNMDKTGKVSVHKRDDPPDPS